MIYDYKDMLQVDDETYELWEPTITIHERQAGSSESQRRT